MDFSKMNGSEQERYLMERFQVARHYVSTKLAIYSGTAYHQAVAAYLARWPLGADAPA